MQIGKTDLKIKVERKVVFLNKTSFIWYDIDTALSTGISSNNVKNHNFNFTNKVKKVKIGV